MPNVPHYSSKFQESLSLIQSCYCVYCLSLENKAIGVMKPGHSFTIEPMINQGRHTHTHTLIPSVLCIFLGTWKDVTWPDDWTSTTVVSSLFIYIHIMLYSHSLSFLCMYIYKDGKRSAQFEHTLIVTETGHEILTGRREHGGQPHFLTSS